MKKMIKLVNSTTTLKKLNSFFSNLHRMTMKRVYHGVIYFVPKQSGPLSSLTQVSVIYNSNISSCVDRFILKPLILKLEKLRTGAFTQCLPRCPPFCLKSWASKWTRPDSTRHFLI